MAVKSWITRREKSVKIHLDGRKLTILLCAVNSEAVLLTMNFGGPGHEEARKALGDFY